MYKCDECDWFGTETTRLELTNARDGTPLPKEEIDSWREEDGQMPRTCPRCGGLTSPVDTNPTE